MRLPHASDAAKEPPRAQAPQDAARQVVLRKGAREPRLESARAPAPASGEALVRTLLAGIDGTDEEILEGGHADFPEGEDRLVLGHECLGEVLEAPEASGLAPGDRVVPLVRHGCGLCPPCREGRSDFCSTGLYREHGLKGLDGFLRDRWTDDAATLVKAPRSLGDAAVLAEPLSVVLKALEVAGQVQRRVPGFEGLRARRVLLAGTGSLGSLAALHLVDEGAEVWAMDRTGDEAGSSRFLARVGARHVNARETDLPETTRQAGGFDLVLEATGSPRVAFDAILALRENGVLCMLGVPPQKRPIPLEADDMMRGLVMKNQCVVGSVNSSRRHVEQALTRLARLHERRGSLVDEVITHRFPPEACAEAFRAGGPDLVKKVVDWR